MLRLGERQTLTVVKLVRFGVYLAENAGDEERVLLPAAEVPEDTGTGAQLEVFLYKDSSDRLIATTRTPLLTLGHTAVLKVRETGKIGAFLDWGLPKDLLLPFREQTRRVTPGEECLCALYIDKTGRLAATMKVYPYLKQLSPYGIGDTVEGRVYETSGNFGIFVAVDDCYSGMLPRYEGAGLEPGDKIRARVTGVKEDGKLDLSIRDKAYLQMDEDAALILDVLDEYEGALPFSDKASPEVIAREFGMSKAAFKRAVGRLLKQGKIRITENRILRAGDEEENENG